jgi:hypothetical protein
MQAYLAADGDHFGEVNEMILSRNQLPWPPEIIGVASRSPMVLIYFLSRFQKATAAIASGKANAGHAQQHVKPSSIVVPACWPSFQSR